MSEDQLISLPQLPYLLGTPKSCGDLRTRPEDFKVFEQLPFALTGEGEHLFIHIRKTGTNTLYVARQLARYFKVKEALVSYAGLKDRHAVTEQYFGVHLPGKANYDLSDLAIDGVEVLSYQRHNKKLKNGALSGNNFEITLRNVTDIEDVLTRWQSILMFGVPNYFGEQRFGINGQNLEAATTMMQGKKVKDKKKRGFYLSAARSLVFNSIVAKRIEQGHFLQPLDGDVFMLSGSRSVFLEPKVSAEIIERLKQRDLNITAAMWGSGELMTTERAKEIELTQAQQYPVLTAGLGKFGLKQERRSIRLTIDDADITDEGSTVSVKFFLPAGSFATTVLRELIDYQDLSQQSQITES
ncbi:tRNA pseudouridine(13) synthase TruD [Thalassotalea aquiviva]|uniref:tRNA pseudouridine(13) synthase TruD n=1 Tax=Thalassotalea aquiviva TaxID=3242415 RepID=UPI00352A1B9B